MELVENGTGWGEDASICQCAHDPVVMWTDQPHGDAQTSGVGGLVPDKAEFCSQWSFSTNHLCPLWPSLSPPEPKDEVEVSDDGECWPPVLRRARGVEGGERGI